MEKPSRMELEAVRLLVSGIKLDLKVLRDTKQTLIDQCCKKCKEARPTAEGHKCHCIVQNMLDLISEVT